MGVRFRFARISGANGGKNIPEGFVPWNAERSRPR
jgi:hypothetical protein